MLYTIAVILLIAWLLGIVGTGVVLMLDISRRIW